MRSALAAILLTLCALPVARAELPRQLRACGDASEYPPYTYRSADGVAGYNVDLLQAVLGPSGRRVKVSLLPWARCLQDAAAGRYELVLDSAPVASRETSFLFAHPHYRVTPVLLFHKARPLPPIHRPEDASAIKLCHVLGWDYSGAGIQPAYRAGRPVSVPAALAMLRAGRCQAMIWNQELTEGLQRTGRHGGLLDEAIGQQPLPWIPRGNMHLLVSRATPHAAELLALLDAGIDRLLRSGEAQRLLARHLDR